MRRRKMACLLSVCCKLQYCQVTEDAFLPSVRAGHSQTLIDFCANGCDEQIKASSVAALP